MLDDLIGQQKRDWKYNRHNAIKSILDFEHILNYTKPVEQISPRTAHAMARAGGGVRRS